MHLSIDTVLPADSVEFCPHPDASNVFVCGTYKLQDEQNSQSSDSVISPSSGPAGHTQTRTGQCLVYEVDSEQEISACVTAVLSHAHLKLRLYLQLQDPGDIPPCSFGSEMVRELYSLWQE